jgi:methyltransferase (TIGR00027 family)
MKPGRASRTAVMVCMARAAAHGRSEVSRFSDPTALALLPDGARARIEGFRSGAPPRSARERVARRVLAHHADMMVARTVAIDDAIRAGAAPQVVILGAGLDGRAFRMPELESAVVFEVDHPDSQRDKRARAAALSPRAREVRYVPVDFTVDDLDAALAAAGHDPNQPTTWVWEGVVMYLTPAAVDATLAIIARRSAAGSRLVVVYMAPALAYRLVGLMLRILVAEPFRSSFTADAFRDLLARHGFVVELDTDVHAAAAALSPALGRRTRPMRHQRIATARRR